MFAHCKGPIWQTDDISPCFQTDFLQTLFPLIAITLSILVLLFSAVQEKVTSKRSVHYKTQLANGAVEDDAGVEDDDSFTELTLQKTVSRTNCSGQELDQPNGKVLLVAVELITLLAQVGISLTALATIVWSRAGNDQDTGIVAACIAGLVSWTYILVLTAARLLLSTSRWQLHFLKLWNHTAMLYGVLWLLEIWVFRSSIIHPRNSLSRTLNIAEFSLSSTLFLIALLSRKGNRPVLLEHEEDMEPSHEPLASLFSLAVFGWVDAIVWQGYKKTYELSDVWNLIPRDKAASVLAEFRQIKKTHSLAMRLVLFFKRKLLIQGACVMVSNVLLFLPTLLLKAILEYHEDPTSVPSHTAWLYVILLFLIGAAQAILDGQGLWIGRRICIRLRAVIIGEIYAKALRRKAAAGADSELGKEEEKELKPLKKKILSFGRKKKAEVKTENDVPTAKTSDIQANNGTIINLMSIDSFKVGEICSYLHFLWASVPIQVTMAVVLLYRILGFSSFVGIGVMVLILPVNFYIAKSFQRFQKKIMAGTDARIHSTNEVLQNIRIIKYFAWEQRFTNTVSEKRKVELDALRKRYILWALAATIWNGLPILITFVSFLIYTAVEKKKLIPSVAFPALSTFALLRIPLDQLADMVAHVQEAKVSVDRIEEFLNEEETDKYVQLRESKQRSGGVPRIALEGATLTWGSKKEPAGKDSVDAFRLIDMNVEFELGRLNIIAGPTGSGKTSLLMALLGEMKLLEGHVQIPGGSVRQNLRPDPATGLTESVAYCAQQAWLVNATIKDNILFASPMNEQRYRTVIDVCALQRDLEILDAGEDTLVGEKGITLSGGQKQRISLARAMYSNSRHLLLDDCLSAVDSHTAKHIFEKAIMGDLMSNRTCILVTHNVSLTVPRSSYVVVLENGKIVEQGSPNHVVQSGAFGEDLMKSRPGSTGNSTAPSRVTSNLEELKGKHADLSHQSGVADVQEEAKKSKQVIDTRIETKATGSVKITTMNMYLAAMGPWYFWIGAAIAFVATQIGSLATNVWIRQWANSYQGSQTDTVHANFNALRHPASFAANALLRSSLINSPQTSSHAPATFAISESSDVDVSYYLGVYALIGLAYVAVCFFRELLLFGGSIHASFKLHERLLKSVMRAKFRFFDSTPLGQLMNRFSKDLEAIDQEVAPVAIGVIHCLASVVTIFILISVITPGFLIAGFFIGCIYFAIGFFYIHSSRDLKRVESVQRSPLFQAFGETLSGVVTIRAYGDESRFIEDNHLRVNTHNRPFLYVWATNRWLAMRINLTGALVSFSAGAFIILSVGKIDAGAAGLSLSYAITFSENVFWLVRLYASNEQNMNSVERVKEYIDVEQEAKAEIPETKPPGNWPSHGGVQFIGYTTRYRSDLDPVLKHVSFNIRPGEKVGIVGRTGAGKSSLALALFRGLEAEEGKILIDDVDIGLIGLQDLRESITIVPQDPTLFTGTLRSNLDPFDIFTDEEILAALRRVQLITAKTAESDASGSGASTPDSSGAAPTLSASSTPRVVTAASSTSDAATLVRFTSNSRDNKNIFQTLSSPVSESGSNLSQGQRQLLCLARALLKAPRVLLMDEATASIDYATDAKIQDTLRELKDNTIITIAHRLQTIIDYDKVLVLDQGEVVEFADPWELIRQEGGSFRAMCETSGDFETLMTLAKKAWADRRLIDDS